ncbi:MAG TPA: 6,7-dimethyl-8-ribityllumazine synthase [Gemmatimonadales bacterium]|jgi:6,7-dimethyl-8-ribityllumazine synthase|nr:6,7-dimethyl-8-ribityllumazine synthase [Gemmatimonadales bacterium]
MTEFDGQLKPSGRVAIVVSRYHEDITSRLLRGARAVCAEAGIAEDDIDVLHVSGAFELGVVVTAAAHSGRYATIVALGAVVRGETPHFDVIARETAAALARAATDSLIPVGFGLLTCDTMDQAMARAGGTSGNKGREAAEAALRATSLIHQALDE